MNDIKLHQSSIFLSTLPPVDREEVKQYLVKHHAGAMSDEALDLFINIAATNSLNPYKREIYAVPYWNSKSGKMDIQAITAYTVYLARANMTGMLNGWTTEIEKDIDGKVIGGSITIHRKDWDRPFVWSVSFDEIVQKTKEGKPNSQYASKPEFMTKKVLISQGMRLCFPEYLSSMPYEESEMPVGEIIDGQLANQKLEDKKPRVVRPPKRIEPTVNITETSVTITPEPLSEVLQNTQEEKSEGLDDIADAFVSEKNGKETPPKEEKPQDPEMITDAQLKFMHILCQKTGHSIEEIKGIVEKQYKVKSRKLLTKAQAISFMNELIEIIEFNFTAGGIKLTQQEINSIWQGAHNAKKREELVKYLD